MRRPVLERLSLRFQNQDDLCQQLAQLALGVAVPGPFGQFQHGKREGGNRRSEAPFNAMTIIILVAGAYISTNVDNLLLLVGWMLGRRESTLQILAGHGLAALAVLLAAFLLGLSAAALPTSYIGYLGVVPIVLGISMLLQKIRGRTQVPIDSPPQVLSVFAVATTLFANSADTMLVFSPLLADSEVATDYVILAAYPVMAAVWFLLALFFSRHAAHLRGLSVAAEWLAPVIMIIVGFYILDNTVTDVVLGS
jgi:cadmium resistance protein CadD (predicted permease)